MPRVELARRIAGYAGVGLTSVYLVLKILWIAGIPVGLGDQEASELDDMLVPNLLTGVMALVGGLVLLAFSQPWGHRIPSWLVVFPTWVGTGLLVPSGLTFVLVALLAGAGIAPWPTPTGIVAAAWLQPVVYSCFTGMGICLAVTFAGHVRERWPGALYGKGSESPTRSIQLPLAWTGALLASGVVLARLQWGLGGGAALDPANADARVSSWYTVHLVHAVLVLAGAVAMLGLLHLRSVRHPGRLLAVAWTGTGTLFAAGIIELAPGLLTGTDQPWTLPEAEYVLTGVLFLELLAGVTLGLAALLCAADRVYASSRTSSASRWTVSGENAGRQTATYSAPSGPGVE